MNAPEVFINTLQQREQPGSFFSGQHSRDESWLECLGFGCRFGFGFGCGLGLDRVVYRLGLGRLVGFFQQGRSVALGQLIQEIRLEKILLFLFLNSLGLLLGLLLLPLLFENSVLLLLGRLSKTLHEILRQQHILLVVLLSFLRCHFCLGLFLPQYAQDVLLADVRNVAGQFQHVVFLAHLLECRGLEFLLQQILRLEPGYFDRPFWFLLWHLKLHFFDLTISLLLRLCFGLLLLIEGLTNHFLLMQLPFLEPRLDPLVQLLFLCGLVLFFRTFALLSVFLPVQGHTALGRLAIVHDHTLLAHFPTIIKYYIQVTKGTFFDQVNLQSVASVCTQAYVLGIDIKQARTGIFFHHYKQRFGMSSLFTAQPQGPVLPSGPITDPSDPIIPFNYKYLVIVFLVIKYLVEQTINLRQLKRNLIKDIPDQLRKYRISQNEFLLSQSYSFDKITFEMLALSIRMAVDTLTIMCNLLPFIWNNVGVIFPFISIDSQFQRAVGYTLIEAFKSKAFEVPISAYQTFVIEKKYNFTNKTVELFIYDLFVEATQMLIIFPPIIYGYLQVVQIGEQHFYLFLQVFVICITILLTWIHPNLVAPMFNKFTELKDSHLRNKIYEIANKNSIKLSKIYVIDSSVRSAHSNAYLYGLGPTKVIVLYDSLLQNLTMEQTLAVLAHEMGHCYHSHSIKKLGVYLVEALCMFYIFAQFIRNESVFISFGFAERSVFICTTLYFHIFEPLTSVFNTLLLVVTRAFEFEADLFACEQGFGEELKKSLIKLFRESTSIVKPDIVYAWIKHSHPSIYERIDSIDLALLRNSKKYQTDARLIPRKSAQPSTATSNRPHETSHFCHQEQSQSEQSYESSFYSESSFNSREDSNTL